ncbi:hypothetical protein [Chitinophaga niastensis]|nr:hypothetical protein [Chitinophaga niastensis]
MLEFLAAFDGKTMAEAREILSNHDQEIAHYIDFLKAFKEEAPKSYKADEEKFDEPYTLPSPESVKAKYTAYFAAIGFKQQVVYPNFLVVVEDTRRRSDGLGDLEVPGFETEKIFFHDGSSDNKKYLLDGATKIVAIKTADSILTNVNYSYTTKMVKVTLDKSNRSQTYKGAEIKIVKLDDNRVKLMMRDSAYQNYLYVEALNKDGKPLDYSSRTSSAMESADFKEILNDYSKALKNLIKQFDKGVYKDIASLKKAIAAQISDKSPFDDTTSGFTENYYHGNIDKVNVYLSDGRNKIKQQTVLQNIEPNYTGYTLTQDEKTSALDLKISQVNT